MIDTSKMFESSRL